MTTDRFTIRSVALGLLLLAVSVVVALVYVLGVVSLSDEQKTQALTALISMGTLAAGAAAALLAHTASPDPTPIQTVSSVTTGVPAALPPATFGGAPGLTPGPG